jgi:integrase
MGVKVRERPKDSGIWWVFVDHQGQRKAKKIGPNKELAEKTAEIVRANLLLDRPLFGEERKKPAVPTLQQYYERFERSYMQTTLKPTTYESYERSFRLYLLPQFGRLRLDQIDRQKMQDFVAWLMQRNLAKDSIRITLTPLGVLFNDAIENGIVHKNPAQAMAKFYRQAPVRHDEINPLAEKELLTFLKVAMQYTPRYYPLFLCALHTGMRSGELAGVQWWDIDWNGKFIEVRRHVVNGTVSDLKTKSARRRVDCSDELMEVLMELRRQRQAEWLKKGFNEIPEWVFVNTVGNFLDMRNVKRRYFKVALRKAGLREIRFHDLRHTYASMLLAQGEPVTYVSRQLGHSNPQITLRIYAHWIPNESQREVVNRLPGLRTTGGE